MRKKKSDRDELDDRDWSPVEVERLYEDEHGEEITEAVKLDVAADLHISDDIDTELRQQPKLYAWYAQLKEEARHEMKRAKYRVYCTKEDTYARLRRKEDDADVPVSKRLNETQIKARVNRSPKVRAAYELYMQATEDFRKLEEHCEALKQRSRLLQSLNANRNAEYDDPR